MTVPTVSVRVAPGSNANDLNPRWSEVGSLLRSFSFSRGRQYELDRIDAGTATFTFNNSSRTLDPAYTLGPYYPDLLPNMQISLQATYAGVTYDLFRGHVERFSTSWDGPNYGETTFECVDRLVALSQATITGTFNEQRTGARILAVLAAAGWPTTFTPSGWTLGTSALGVSTRLGATLPVNVIDTGRATVAASTFVDTDAKLALDHIQDVSDSERGRFFFDAAGRAVFQDRSRYAPYPPALALTLTDGAGGSGSSGGSGVYAGAAFGAGVFAGGSTSTMSYRDVVFNYDIDLVRNDVRLTASDGTTVVAATDSASIDTYWRRTLPLTTLLRAADSDMWQQANWLLYSRKNALQRIQEVTCDVWQTSDWPLVLPRELGDHVSVNRTPPGATSQTITQESLIEKIEMSGEPGAKWQVRYQLSPIVPSLTPWQLGVSQLGTSTRIVYS